MIYRIAALLICFCDIASSEDSTNYISFFFVTNSVPLESLWRGDVKLSDVKMAPRPVLSDADFTSFDFSNYTFSVSAIAAKRFSTALWYPDSREPAIPRSHPVVAPDHQSSLFSSNIPSLEGHVPFLYRSNTPVAYELEGPDRIFVLVASGVPIYVGAFSGPLSSGSYGIAAVYPDDLYFPIHSTNDAVFSIRFSGGDGPDLRGDLRIRNAAEKLFQQTNTLFFTNSPTKTH